MTSSTRGFSKFLEICRSLSSQSRRELRFQDNIPPAINNKVAYIFVKSLNTSSHNGVSSLGLNREFKTVHYELDSPLPPQPHNHTSPTPQLIPSPLPSPPSSPFLRSSSPASFRNRPRPPTLRRRLRPATSAPPHPRATHSASHVQSCPFDIVERSPD